MIIDINMHWLPEDLLTNESLRDKFVHIVPRAYGEYAESTTIPGTNQKQITISKPKGYENLNFGPEHVSPKGRVEAMDEAGVDKAILRIPCWQEWLDLEMSRKLNDGMAKYINQHPDRFYGLGIVPPWGDKESFKEAERCINELGFVGMEVAAHYGNLYLDVEEFRPYFRKLNKLGVPVCIHHVPLPVDYGSIYEFANLRRLYGRCVCQSTMLGRILFSGLLDECPNLILIPTMLAGGFFAYVNLIAPERSGVKEEMERFDLVADKLKGYLEKNIYFGISHPSTWGKAQLECAVKVHGADHILFGGSYPVRREWLINGVKYVKSLDISEKEKSLILGENAMKIFNIR